MKKAIFAFITLGAFAPLFGQDFSTTLPRQPQGSETSTTVMQPRGGGTLQRAARTKNAAQLVNPRAPRSAGDAHDLLVYDEGRSTTGGGNRPRPVAVTLFSFEF